MLEGTILFLPVANTNQFATSAQHHSSGRNSEFGNMQNTYERGGPLYIVRAKAPLRTGVGNETDVPLYIEERERARCQLAHLKTAMPVMTDIGTYDCASSAVHLSLVWRVLARYG